MATPVDMSAAPPSTLQEKMKAKESFWKLKKSGFDSKEYVKNEVTERKTMLQEHSAACFEQLRVRQSTGQALLNRTMQSVREARPLAPTLELIKQLQLDFMRLQEFKMRKQHDLAEAKQFLEEVSQNNLLLKSRLENLQETLKQPVPLTHSQKKLLNIGTQACKNLGNIK